MKKLAPPNISFNDMLDKCADGMSQEHVRRRFISVFPYFYAKEQQYSRLSQSGSLYTYPKLNSLTDATVVIGHLTKRKLINLYENNLLNKNKPARSYYDELLLSSGERCPFCGDIGHTNNLDHFLPKAHFPEFSVMPMNLVPSCRDCNMGEKGESFATTADKQAIHPYMDKNIFFEECWISAEYLQGEDGAFRFYVNCPDYWSNEDKSRAEHHFKSLNIGSRYRLEAGKHLSEVIDQKRGFLNTLKRLTPQATTESINRAFIEANLMPIIQSEQFPNHWKKVMYRCLANSDSFLIQS